MQAPKRHVESQIALVSQTPRMRFPSIIGGESLVLGFGDGLVMADPNQKEHCLNVPRALNYGLT